MIYLLKDGQIAERWRVEDAKKSSSMDFIIWSVWHQKEVSLGSGKNVSKNDWFGFLNWAIPGLLFFLYFRLSIQFSTQLIELFLPMTGIEPRIAGVRSTLVPGKDLYEISLNFGISWVNFAAHLRSLRFALRQSNHTQNNSNGCRYIIFLLLKIST